MGVPTAAGFATGAIQAAVLAAGLAVLGELVAQVLPGTVQPHGQIIPGDSQDGRHLRRVAVFQVNFLEQLLIGRRQGREQPPEALAEKAFVGVRRCLRQFLFKPDERTASHIPAAMEVDDGTAEDPVKPGDGAFRVGGLAFGGQRLRQAFLDNVFSQVWIPHPLADEPNEGVEVRQNGVLDLGHCPSMSEWGGRGNDPRRLSEGV